MMGGEMEKLKQKKYNDFYMSIAERVSDMSQAKRLKVGSILVKDGNIISFGWNGTPAGHDNNCEDMVYPNKYAGDFEQHYDEFDLMFPLIDESGERYQLRTKPEVLHAEENLLMKIARSTNSSENATIFVTHAPCLDCAKLIHQAGINSVYYRNSYRDDKGIDFLKKCGVQIENVSE